ncbi:hypothetical protein pb186bvf_000803 [Paramecium bursaria]
MIFYNQMLNRSTLTIMDIFISKDLENRDILRRIYVYMVIENTNNFKFLKNGLFSYSSKSDLQPKLLQKYQDLRYLLQLYVFPILFMIVVLWQQIKEIINLNFQQINQNKQKNYDIHS